MKRIVQGPISKRNWLSTSLSATVIVSSGFLNRNFEKLLLRWLRVNSLQEKFLKAIYKEKVTGTLPVR
jgi:hypothetical protein